MKNIGSSKFIFQKFPKVLSLVLIGAALGWLILNPNLFLSSLGLIVLGVILGYLFAMWTVGLILARSGFAINPKGDIVPITEHRSE